MMKRVSLSISAVTLLAVFASLSLAPAFSHETKTNLGKVRHVVQFKFKDDTTPEQVKTIVDAFRALPKQIPQIIDFEWGTNNSPEGKADGFTHCFFLTFRNTADRDAYLPHPAHKAFGKVLRPHLDKVQVFDYVAKD